MHATDQDIVALKDLQEVDAAYLRAAKQLRDLEVETSLADLRAHRDQVAAQRDQIAEVFQREERRLQRYAEEDDDLLARAKSTQADMQAAASDYARIKALTRDLEGIAKRRESVEFEMGKIDTRIEELRKLLALAQSSLDSVDQRFNTQSQKIEEDKELLKQSCLEAQSSRETLRALISPNVLQAYESAARRCGGIGLSVLDGDTCKTCRNTIERNRLLEVMREAPLGTCPHCKRLLVIED